LFLSQVTWAAQYEIAFHGPGKVNKGVFGTLDTPIDENPSLFLVTGGKANVGLCPDDPEDLEAKYSCNVFLGGEPVYFNPSTKEFWALVLLEVGMPLTWIETS